MTEILKIGDKVKIKDEEFLEECVRQNRKYSVIHSMIRYAGTVFTINGYDNDDYYTLNEIPFKWHRKTFYVCEEKSCKKELLKLLLR